MDRVTHNHRISQNGRKAQHKRLVTPLTDSNQGETRPIASHRTVRRNAHRLLSQKIDLREGGAYLAKRIEVAKLYHFESDRDGLFRRMSAQGEECGRA